MKVDRIIDISPPLTAEIDVWPGDVPYRRDVALDVEGGDHLTLSAIHTTLHLGAHADAPNHFVAGADGIGERPLEAYLGPCQVIEVQVGRGQRILPHMLAEPVRQPRVLLKTGTFPDPTAWNTDFASLSPELVDHLHAAGVVLVGLDTPSIDPFDDTELPSHKTLARRGLANLEGLVLSHVAPGDYTLVALPLALIGCDASPVRAVLLG